MMRINYAGEQVLTGDEAAMLLVEFASELGKRASTEIVDLNILQASGEQGISRFLIGPASQLAVTSDETSAAEPDNHEAIAFMRSHLTDMQAYGHRTDGDDS